MDRWVLIAPERAAKPTELESPSHLTHHAVCPFCEGHEDETMPEVLALRGPDSRPNGPGWRVRVIANRYPAVRRDAAGEANDHALWAARPAVGVHEVVIECPQHETSLSALPLAQVQDVFAAMRDRLAALRQFPDVAYAQVFKNHGVPAGASVEHAHSQILGLPHVPRDVREELDGALIYHQMHGRCVYCDLLAGERAAGARMVLETDHVAAFTAYAGRFPYETWVLPKRHDGHFDQLQPRELADVASGVRTILRRLDIVVDDLSYNLLLHTLPLRDPESATYHWRLAIVPRLTGIAGFELATGYFINPLPPEEAAARLRGGV